MKIINIILTAVLILLFYANCSQPPHYDMSPTDYDIYLNGNKNFGNIPVNGSSAYETYEIYLEDKYPDSHYTYGWDVKIKKVTISDNVNFTLDTSDTDDEVQGEGETYFDVKFNPKSAGNFNAEITVETAAGNKSIWVYGTGI